MLYSSIIYLQSNNKEILSDYLKPTPFEYVHPDDSIAMPVFYISLLRWRKSLLHRRTLHQAPVPS